MLNIIKYVKNDTYNITVINHNDYTYNILSVDHAISSQEVDLSAYGSIMMHQKAYDTVTSQKKIKHPNSTVIVTSDNYMNKYSDVLVTDSYVDLSNALSHPLSSIRLFLDKIELTLPLAVEEVEKLRNSLDKDVKNYKRIKRKKVHNPRGVKFRNQFNVDKTVSIGESITFSSREYHALLSNVTSVITILTNPISKNIRNVKVVVNPEKAHPHDMFMTFKRLQQACGDNYQNVIEQAMITRVDYTFDISDLPVDILFFCLAKSQYSTTYISEGGRIESKIDGANGGHRINAYDRLNKLNKDAAIRSDTEALNQLSTWPITTRFEVTFRPHRDKKLSGLRLKDYPSFGSPLKGVNIYDGNKLLQLPEFSDNYQQAKYFGVNSWKRNFTGAKKVDIDRKLRKCMIPINHEVFEKMQSESYKKLFDFLLKPTAHADFRNK
ncbi:hypothetical protein [Colwellia sp. 12G3]|uniref:hypothetical protein n=1 Tax=Colwellia sp. 12G3 TaxID=2058299 RepID=UPI000C3297F1|nr:hypothetical protein [Colwellia sp. 12G3]PKI12953.1 hypothetical protein CXF71_19795 [Colwellia sp. 12G3]